MKAKKNSLVLAVVLVLVFSAGLLAADLNPVNPNANTETKCLYNYMLSIYKTKTLAGQDAPADAQWLKDTTGKYPAICGFDFEYYSQLSLDNGSYGGDVEKAIKWHNDGGIVQIQWHWLAPMNNTGAWYKTFYTDSTNFDVSVAMNNTSSNEYKAIIKDLDLIAVQLKRLQDAGVPVLWRPLHEAEGKWFWWGAKGADACKKLYYLMYDRFTNYHKLNNLIWVWTINCCSTSLSGSAQSWYPGNDKVDINGVDLYLGLKDYQTADGLFNQVEAASGYRKMAAITEGGNVPNAGSKWIWFSTWNGTDFIRNPNRNEPWHNTAVFNDGQVITRDELNITCGPTAVPTNTAVPTSTPTPYPIAGKIEAENYKAGGEGIAYHDVDAVNDKGQYRTDGVDIETCTDAGGGYNVASIQAGEWLAYNVNVLQVGNYNMTVRVANLGAGGTFHVNFNGVNKSGTLTVPDTNGWQTWADVIVPVSLSAGVQEMRIVVDAVNASGYMGNLNYVSFTAVIVPTNTFTKTNTPVPPTYTFTKTNTPVPPTETFTKTSTPVPPTVVPTTPPTVVPTTPPTVVPTTPPTVVPTTPPTVVPTTPVPPTAVPTTPVPTNTSVPPTAVPTNTSVPPTAIPTTPVPPTAVPTTPVPTNTPVVPTATPTTQVSAKFTINTKNLEINNSTNNIKPQFRVINNGTADLNLDSIEVRYWFNCDCTGQALQAWSDWAGKLPSGANINSNVQVSLVQTNLGAQTNYLRVKFTGGITLKPGEYAEVQTRVNKGDWSNMLQSNDWSYSGSQNWQDWNKTTAYMNGSRVYGTEPVSAAAQDPSVANVYTYPNPAKPGTGTTISYTINASQSGITAAAVDQTIAVPDPSTRVYVNIYTVAGRLIWQKVLEGASYVSVGEHVIRWDGKAAGDHEISAGAYTLKIVLKSSGGTSAAFSTIIMLK